MAEIIAQTGLGWGSGKELSVEVDKLGFICFSLMALGLNRCSPVATKAALMVSEVKARSYASPKTPAKSFLPTFSKCMS